VTTVLIGHTQMHDPIPGFTEQATCCASAPGGGRCPWHADAEHDVDAAGRPAVRSAAGAHAATARHRVLFDDAVSQVTIEVTS
jgi:hypothetical protein